MYEYANHLARRGHHVAVVHPLHLKYCSFEHLTLLQRLRRGGLRLQQLLSSHVIEWQPIDKEVNVLFVVSSGSQHLPDSDIIFATSWHTVKSVLNCPPTKGRKCYLIQGYETWQGPKAMVDATWLALPHKVVIAKWLRDKGTDLGCAEMTYIPNGINHQIYRLKQPIEERCRRVAMAWSSEGVKGSNDGIAALEIAKERFPDLKAVLFSLSIRQPSVPKWIEYHCNPSQDMIVNHIYNHSSVFLCPSLCEGWPLPPAEAAACGCALVSTDNGGIREYVQDGITGVLSPPGDPNKLAENLCLVLGSDDMRVRLAKAGNRMVSQFNWDASAVRLEEFAEQIADPNWKQSMSYGVNTIV